MALVKFRTYDHYSRDQKTIYVNPEEVTLVEQGQLSW